MASDTTTQAFKDWFGEKGGVFQSGAEFVRVSSGLSVVAKDVLPAHTSIVSCPFSLAITPELAGTALLDLLSGLDSSTIKAWSTRQTIASYLALHTILKNEVTNGDGESSSYPWKILKHLPYVQVLPPSEQLRTALHFSSKERELFLGSNLYGAILDRERAWKKEWEECQRVVSAVNQAWGKAFTWDLYLTSASHLSSRAFPSTVLSQTPSLVATPTTEPILLPGIDSLNHARGHPVSWVVDHPKEGADASEPSISLVLRVSTNAQDELFNNYGLKPNAELILGYGFSIENNPDDTIVLKVGGKTEGLEPKKWEIGRHTSGIEGLWDEIVSIVSSKSEEGGSYENILEAAGILAEMTQDLLDKLPLTGNQQHPDVREDVETMWRHYIEGQSSILLSVLHFASEKEKSAIEMAKEQGIELVFDDDDDVASDSEV